MGWGADGLGRRGGKLLPTHAQMACCPRHGRGPGRRVTTLQAQGPVAAARTWASPSS
jgi:hypothetical protein